MDTEELRSSMVRSTRHLTTTRRSSLTVPPPPPLSLPSSDHDTDVPLRSTHRIRNYSLVLLDSTIDESADNIGNYYRHLLIQLKELLNTYKIFTDADECVRFLTQVTNQKILMIVSGFSGEYMMPLVHDMEQIDSIYVLSHNVRRHERWTKNWTKIMGIFIEMNSICEILKQILSPEKNNSTPIHPMPKSDEHYLSLGFIALDDDVENENLDELDPSFMFTKVLKEILLELEYNEESMHELTRVSRELFQDNKEELAIIDDFDQNYHSRTPIWWYTRESFTYKMLNRALRTLEADTIIKMGFFLRDVHQQIVELHMNQFTNDSSNSSSSSSSSSSNSFTVYRGQSLTMRDFYKLKKSQGGLMSFNNFLSTSRNRTVALQFALGANETTDCVGVLFVMQIDSLHSSTPFAHVTDVSSYQKEDETLFSMHCVFRINSIEIFRIDHKEDSLYQVNLTMTTDDHDKQLRFLTERLRDETRGSSGWDRMGKLLIKLGMFHNAQEAYDILVKQTTNDIEKAHIYHQLGYIKEDLGEYDDALSFYEESLEIKQKDPPSDGSHFAIYYSSIGCVYDKKGDSSKAAAFFVKAIDIYQHILPPNDLRLATCYNNIASAYHNMCEYSKALLYYEKALAIDQTCLPPSDPSLGSDYNNTGLVYHDMQMYDEALLCFENTLEIYKKSLQSNHPSFSDIYSNFGSLYNSMGDYVKALSYYERALDIDQKTLPPNHPYLGVSYNNIGSVYKNMEEYSRALTMFESALDIEKSSRSPNDSHLQLYTKNIEFVKEKLQ